MCAIVTIVSPGCAANAVVSITAEPPATTS
jgi:hypothetical protein